MNLQEWVTDKKGGRKLLADALGVTNVTVGNIVNGKYKPSIKQCIVINEVTGLNISELDADLAKDIDLIIDKGIL